MEKGYATASFISLCDVRRRDMVDPEDIWFGPGDVSVSLGVGGLWLCIGVLVYCIAEGVEVCWRMRMRIWDLGFGIEREPIEIIFLDNAQIKK
jgi:hypothetical protein